MSHLGQGPGGLGRIYEAPAPPSATLSLRILRPPPPFGGGLVHLSVWVLGVVRSARCFRLEDALGHQLFRAGWRSVLFVYVDRPLRPWLTFFYPIYHDY